MTRKYAEIFISDKPDSELFKSLLDRLKTEFDAIFIDIVEDLMKE